MSVEMKRIKLQTMLEEYRQTKSLYLASKICELLDDYIW